MLDFWASWCSPCIANSRNIVPIYKKYADKGFTVIGIAREFKNTTALKNRLAQESFSWMQLVELEDQNTLWSKYGLADSGGGMVLIDSTGTIVAVNPSIEEIEHYLSKVLK